MKLESFLFQLIESLAVKTENKSKFENVSGIMKGFVCGGVCVCVHN